MRFVAYESDLGLHAHDASITEQARVDSQTSVRQHQNHYYETLGKLGEIVALGESSTRDELGAICSCDDVIFAGFHEGPPDSLSCRFLQHSKGALMLPGGFLDAWTFHESTLNLVTTRVQSDQIRNGLGNAAPNTSVFVPRLHPVFIRAGEEVSLTNCRQPRITGSHLVYAGRWIANKGICQAVRALNIWPLRGAELTLIGSYEPDFPIQWCDANNCEFPDFFRRECVSRNKTLPLRMLKSMTPSHLRDVYSTTDAFLYPSFHEDENFGMAPREAILCGVPAVVSDFSGLGEIGNFPGQYRVKTFPTLAGIRYSIWELRVQIARATAPQSISRKAGAAEILSQCDEASSTRSLLAACQDLLLRQPSAPAFRGWRSEERFNHWIARAPANFTTAVHLHDRKEPKGLYPGGPPQSEIRWFSEPHFFQAIQSLYTTLATPPLVATGITYRGFWRLELDVAARQIVEHGYPGPRRIKFRLSDWSKIQNSATMRSDDEVEFVCRDHGTAKCLQHLVNLGYIVPDVVPTSMNV